MTSAQNRSIIYLLWIGAATIILPIVAGKLLTTLYSGQFVSIPLHSVVETTGGVISIVISMIFYIKYEKARFLTHFNWSTGALLAMGIIDIFHASVLPGNLFVWLHSTAVFFGGILFVTVWLPEHQVSERFYRAMPIFFTGFSILFGTFSVLMEPSLPLMLTPDGGFTETANLLNMIGGAGFFIAGVKFVFAYLNTQDREELLFAGHTLLFGTAGILFVSSVIWDLQWWLWHVLRLMAYSVALYVLYMEYRQDIFTIEQSNRKLATAHQKIGEYLDIVDQNVIVSSTNPKGIITDASEAFCKISGYSKEELIGRPHNIVRHPDMPHQLFAGLWQTIRSGSSWHGEIKNRAKDGHAYWVNTVITPITDDKGEITGYTAIRQDITDKKRIEVLSVTDELSGLYNRRRFNDIVQTECNRAMRDRRRIAFALLDIDHFKQYNDTYGHKQGDDVISMIGKELKTHARRSGDFAFRLGGEEFGMLFSASDERTAFEYAEGIRRAIEALKLEHKVNSTGPYVSVSIGVELFNGDEPCTSLYTDADVQLYRAKTSGRNRVMMQHIAEA